MVKSERDLYNSVKWQNEMIAVENAKMRDQYSTATQRSKYLLGTIENWKYYNTWLWFIYYILVVYICFVLYNQVNGYTTQTKWYIAFSFVLFPFLITTAELFFHKLYTIIDSLVTGKPYPKSISAPSLSLLDALPPLYA